MQSTAHQLTDTQRTADHICEELLKQKLATADIKIKIDALEQELIATVGNKDEGSISIKSDHFKVTTTGKVNRTVSPTEIWAIKDLVPVDIFNTLFPMKPGLNLKLYKDLRDSNPELHRTISRAITSKPGKTAVKVEHL